MMAVTLYYHRDQAHRSVDLHPVVRHFCRFWLWLNTGSSTREWVAVHRKHHAHCEKEGDPHSPRLFGLKKVVLEGAELYRVAARDRDTLEKYAKGTPNDWLENNLYHHPTRSYYGICVARRRRSRVVRCAGHHHDRAAARRTCRSSRPASSTASATRRATATSRPTTRRRTSGRSGFSIAGEELHNNHHAFPTSARFSMRRHEVDMGWLHLKVLVWLGLAKIRRVANPPRARATRREPRTDLDELRAIIVNRMHVLRHYTLQRHVAGAAPRARKPRRERELVGARDAQASELAAGDARRVVAQAARELAERHPRFKTVLAVSQRAQAAVGRRAHEQRAPARGLPRVVHARRAERHSGPRRTSSPT